MLSRLAIPYTVRNSTEIVANAAPIAVAALRHLIQAQTHRLYIVEDAGTSRIMNAVTPRGSYAFFHNLRQLGCKHYSYFDSRLNRETVLELVTAISNYLHSQPIDAVSAERLAHLKRAISALVDRDIPEGFLPTSLNGQMSLHPRSFGKPNSSIRVVTTPLNDIESTAFTEQIDLIVDRLEIREELAASLLTTKDANLGAALIRQWLVPMFVVRSVFAYMRPKISTRGFYKLIGTNWMTAHAGLERGLFALACARSTNPDRRWRNAQNEQLLVDETREALKDSANHHHLIHGHDLCRVLAAQLIIRRSGKPIADAEFLTTNEQVSFRDCNGVRELEQAENYVLDAALSMCERNPSSMLMQLISAVTS